MRIILALAVLFAALPAIAQNKFAEDRKLIAQYVGEHSEKHPTELKSQPQVSVQAVRDFSYKPGKSYIDLETLVPGQPYYYEQVLRDRIKQDEVNTLVKAETARVIPQGIEDSWVTYPDNWRSKVKKREKYKDGVIARGPSHVGEDGKEWYVAVYDISDLTYNVPNFESDHVLTAVERYRRSLEIQRRYNYWDPFGGSEREEKKPVGPTYSKQKAQDIVELIRAFTEQQDGAQVKVIGFDSDTNK